jgi:hypothetical protein
LVPCVDRQVAETIVERLQAFDLPPKAVSANTNQGGWNEEGRRRRVRDRGRRDAGPGHVGEIEQGGWSNPYFNDELATCPPCTMPSWRPVTDWTGWSTARSMIRLAAGSTRWPSSARPASTSRAA